MNLYKKSATALPPDKTQRSSSQSQTKNSPTCLDTQKMSILRPCALVAARMVEKMILLWNATKFVMLLLLFTAGFKYRHFKSATLHGIYNVLTHLLILSLTASGSALIVKMTPVHQ
jgi:hypothetical protein